MNHVTVKSFTAKIYIAGDIGVARQACREYVMQGLCVQLKECDYIYTGGMERGVEITLINYARFLTTTKSIKAHAIKLAEMLIGRLCQRSASVVTDADSIYISIGEEE